MNKNSQLDNFEDDFDMTEFSNEGQNCQSYLDGIDFSVAFEKLHKYEKHLRMQNVIDRCIKYINYLAPVVLIMNVPIALIAALWLLFTGGLSLVVCAVASYVLGPYIVGILTSPAKFFINIDDIELSSFGIALFHWLVVSIWGYITIARGVIYGVSLSLPTLPTLILCSAICTLPFFRVLRDTLASGNDEAGAICIIVTAFAELASLMSIIIFSIFFNQVTYIQVVVIFTFSLIGVFSVLIHCMTLIMVFYEERTFKSHRNRHK